MCIAPTGSGKTLAYVLPTIVKLGDPARNLRGKEQGEEQGQGVRAVILVPTHDLAVQILAVVKAVTRGRAWRCLVLTKATEKAVCESSPGENLGGAEDEDEQLESASVDEDGELEEDHQHDEEEDEGAKTGNVADSEDHETNLGVDLLIATPERLHHLIDSGRLSLAPSATHTSRVSH